MSDTDPQQKLLELAQDMRFGMLTTIDEHGHFVSRPMSPLNTGAADEFWFFTEATSRKARHLAADTHVGLTLSQGQTWVSLSGTAEVIKDDAKAEELWNPFIEAWLPQGPRDPNTVLIRFTAETGEYWDTPGGAVATVISFVKSKVTGRRFEGGDNERVEL